MKKLDINDIKKFNHIYYDDVSKEVYVFLDEDGDSVPVKTSKALRALIESVKEEAYEDGAKFIQKEMKRNLGL